MRELAEFRERAKHSRKEARKNGKRAEVEASLLQEELEIEARHSAELMNLDDDSEEEEEGDLEKERAAAAEKARREEEAIECKRAKAQRKRGRKNAKDREKAERIASETDQLAKTSERTKELDAICATLAGRGLRLHEVAADGNCLYRAVEHQLLSVFKDETSHLSLRRQTAEYMRSHEDDFISFVALDSDDPQRVYKEHCDKVASEGEWGGQPEILALTQLLNRPIYIYSRDAPLLRMGEHLPADKALQLAFHRHYFALGEHYNSVVPIVEK